MKGEATPHTFTSHCQTHLSSPLFLQLQWLFGLLLLIAITGVQKAADASYLPCHAHSPALRCDRVPAAAPSRRQDHKANILLQSQQPGFFSPAYCPRNANKSLIPCNLLGFPLNPHFNQASPCRRSYQYVPSSQTMRKRANVIVSLRWNDSIPSRRSICTRKQRALLQEG